MVYISTLNNLTIILCFRPEDTLSLTRKLEKLPLKKYENYKTSEEELGSISASAVEAYFNSLKSAKLTRALDKV